ncbi:hypothetical protein BC834DRAFT_41782 [Gloeopeniophorella convolvens]|nr:hypothetical protein BC834DRAFT_41782 [Gloeopeniophorella convolvens]
MLNDGSPLSSAETLTEAPADAKRAAFSARLTRALSHHRERHLSRASTFTSATASSYATEVSEFGEQAMGSGKAESRPLLERALTVGSGEKQSLVAERGRFGFLKKSKTVDGHSRFSSGSDRRMSRSRPPPLPLPSPVPFSPLIRSSVDSHPRLTASPEPATSTPTPDPTSPPSTSSRPASSSSKSDHRRTASTSSAPSKRRIAGKVCMRRDKDKDKPVEPKPARTQPYGPPYNWIPPTPGAWGVAEDVVDSEAKERRRKRASAPSGDGSSQYAMARQRDQLGSTPVPQTAR